MGMATHKIIMKPCESCGSIPETVYATGRFCSSKCARSFSTSQNRNVISQKTSATLKERFIRNPRERISHTHLRTHMCICISCNIQFEVPWESRGRRCCSKQCKQQRLSRSMTQRNIAGNFYQSFGRRVRYTKHGYDIHCDSLIEWCALEHLFQEHGDSITSVTRSTHQIPYEISGRIRTYNPDFDVHLRDGTCFIVECKSEQSGKTPIWERYHREARLKRGLLENWCSERGATSVWFTQNTRRDLYRSLKRDARRCKAAEKVVD